MADSDIQDYEIPKLVHRLVEFLGPQEIERSLLKYKQSLRFAGPVFRDYYLKMRHPWWSALTRFVELEKTGKSIQKNLTTELKILAGDAKQVTTLQRLMPESVRHKYKKDLIDEENAYNYLFEIHIAWHFYLRDYVIQWYADSSRRHAEFLVRTPHFAFDVECKRINVDISRAIRRRDFYRLAEKLIPAVEKEHYTGIVDIVSDGKFHSNEDYLADLIRQVLEIIRSGKLNGHFQILAGKVFLDLHTANGVRVDLRDCFIKLWKRKSPNAHGAMFAKAKNNAGIDPIELTLISEKAGDLLSGIKERLHQAAKEQLDHSRPGLVACFLEGVEDLSELASDSGLQVMTNHLLDKVELSHLAGITYCAEPMVTAFGNMERFSNQGLIFRNPNCRFEAVKAFKFLSEEQEIQE